MLRSPLHEKEMFNAAYEIIFLEPELYKEAETCCNKLYSKIPSSVVLIDCTLLESQQQIVYCAAEHNCLSLRDSYKFRSWTTIIGTSVQYIK